jgi:hypothetical protein
VWIKIRTSQQHSTVHHRHHDIVPYDIFQITDVVVRVFVSLFRTSIFPNSQIIYHHDTNITGMVDRSHLLQTNQIPKDFQKKKEKVV